MIFAELPLAGAYRISQTRHEDERGFFARSYCETEFSARGLETRWVQSNTSYNHRKGTLRGLHFQRPPHEEVKLVRCIRGAIFDVMVDLRRESPTFGKWCGLTLDDNNRDAAYVPRGFAHGYQTLIDDVEVIYTVSAFHAPESEGGLNALDATVSVKWPLPIAAMSQRDRQAPLLQQVQPILGKCEQ